MTVDPKGLHTAWGDFMGEFPAQFGVTLAYNSHHLGTAGPCYRFSPDGECLRVRGSGVVARYGSNRVAGARSVTLEQVHRDLDRLHGRVDRALLGTRFHKLPADRRTAFIGFIEHAASNVHAHLSWRVPEARVEEFASILTETWRATGPAATIDVQPIRDSGWGRYVAKDQYGWTQEAALFVASRPAARV